VRPAHDGAVRPAHDGAVRPAHDGAVRPAHDGAVRPAHDGAAPGACEQHREPPHRLPSGPWLRDWSEAGQKTEG
ncbi:MAG: hypothetical protein ACUVV0_17035, partial [Anaerolineae bacterium]